MLPSTLPVVIPGSYLMKAHAELSREQLEIILADATPVVRETYITLSDQLEQQGMQKGMQQGMRQTLVSLIRLNVGNVSEAASQRTRGVARSRNWGCAMRPLS